MCMWPGYYSKLKAFQRGIFGGFIDFIPRFNQWENTLLLLNLLHPPTHIQAHVSMKFPNVKIDKGYDSYEVSECSECGCGVTRTHTYTLHGVAALRHHTRRLPLISHLRQTSWLSSSFTVIMPLASRTGCKLQYASVYLKYFQPGQVRCVKNPVQVVVWVSVCMLYRQLQWCQISKPILSYLAC